MRSKLSALCVPQAASRADKLRLRYVMCTCTRGRARLCACLATRSGVMTFYDANGSYISGNNFLALLDGKCNSATPLLVAMSVISDGV